MAIAQRRLPWRLPTKWAWAMEKAGPSRKEVAELWRDPARFPVALSLVMLRLALWRDPARFPVALSLVLRLDLGSQAAGCPAAMVLLVLLAFRGGQVRAGVVVCVWVGLPGLGDGQ